MLNTNLKIILIAIFCTAGLANASIVKSIYRADLLAKDKTDETRAKLVEDGFSKILYKTTIDENLANDPELKKAAPDIDKFVSGYTYYKAPEGLQLDIKYNEKMIQGLLKDLGKPFLGKDRPTAVVWLIVDEPSGTRFIGDDKYPEVIDKMNELATTTGIPIVQPLLDLSDKSIVSEDVVAKFNDSPMLMASNRYGADIVIAGKVSKFAGVWQASWRILGKESISWKDDADDLNTSISNFMGEYSRYLVKNYAYQAGLDIDKPITLSVSGINDLESLSKIEKILQNIAIVKEYRVTYVSDNEARFSVEVEGDIEDLDRTLRLNKKLRNSNVAGSDIDTVDLGYNYS